MNIEAYADFYRKRGYHVIKSKTCYWVRYRPFFYHPIPVFKITQPIRSELRSIRLKHAWAGVFYVCSPSVATGQLTDLCAAGDYGLNTLEKKARNQTRRGLENCDVKQISFSELASTGVPINLSSLSRQNRRSIHPDLTNHARWENRMRVSAATQDIIAWGAYVGNKLAAYALTVEVEKEVIIQSTMSDRKYLRYYPNNAIIFTVTKTLLEQGVEKVHYGFSSEDTALVHFKQNMGFRQINLPFRLIIFPLISPLIKHSGRYRHYFSRLKL